MGRPTPIERDGEAIQELRKWARANDTRSFEIDYTSGLGMGLSWQVRIREGNFRGRDYGGTLAVAIRRAREDLLRDIAAEMSREEDTA